MSESSLERAWETYRLQCAPDLPAPRTEYQFDATRKWRLDKAYVDHHVFVEIQGGTWKRGAHSRGAGQTRDCEKHNALTLAGWRGLYVTTDMLNNDPMAHFRQLRELLLNTKGQRK